MTYDDRGYWTRTDRPELVSDRLGYPPERGDEEWARTKGSLMTTTDTQTAPDLYETAVQAACEAFRARGLTVPDDDVRAALGAAQSEYLRYANVTERLDLGTVDADLYEIRDCYDPEMPGSRWTGDALRVASQLRAEVLRLQGEVARRDLWRREKDAEHSMNARGWRDHVNRLEQELVGALDGSALARVQALYAAAAIGPEEPPDGTYLGVNIGDEDERVYVRTDRNADQDRGDWWSVGGTDNVGPLSFREILDEDPEDRHIANVEVLIPASDLGRALAEPSA